MISTMSDLAAKTCVPCRGGVPPLKGEELSVLQKQVDAWNIIEEHHITKTFKFPDFRGALKFVNRAGVPPSPRYGRVRWARNSRSSLSEVTSVREGR
jgi:hypothetical protein